VASYNNATDFLVLLILPVALWSPEFSQAVKAMSARNIYLRGKARPERKADYSNSNCKLIFYDYTILDNLQPCGLPRSFAKMSSHFYF
jgi:hypothetical protein